ncbi:MAG TPA: hypothetical protein VE818_01655 [Nitrososphaeraceae archaeon]|jgi:hypothetical protein|nr:hypothetical protein [Nitrososphaeraceae archaeon]
MVSLSKLMGELKDNIDLNKNLIQRILKKNPNMVYQKINEISLITGSRYNLNLQLHFPDSKKISDIESYGEENIGIVIDKLRRKFPLPRENIKLKAIELMGNIKAQDAYMYEDKEGVKIIFEKGRIEVLPGSCHFWCKIDERVKSYGDWLMSNVYLQ